MALNPIVYTEHVVRSFLRYQLTAYPFADERLHGQMRRLLSLDVTRQSPLLKGPYISLSRPFRQGASVDELIADGVFHPHMRQRIPEQMAHLYDHQEEAIRAIVGGRTTLVSTGTGSGKTECFLYPIISTCLRLKDENAPPGISAVIVYPMNALAEDQLGRLRGLLAGTGITFGMYVGKNDVDNRRLGKVIKRVITRLGGEIVASNTRFTPSSAGAQRRHHVPATGSLYSVQAGVSVEAIRELVVEELNLR